MITLNDVAQFNEKVNKALRDESKPWSSVLNLIEKQIGVDRLYIFWGIVALTTLFVIFDLAGDLICNVIAIIYPAYCSIHAIESTDKKDDTKWLTYWVVFSIFCLADYFTSFILRWFPLYQLAKTVFFIWLMIPTKYNGSLILYNNVIKPYFLEYRAVVDEAINKVQSTASEIYAKREDKK